MLPTPTQVAEDEGKLWCFLDQTLQPTFLASTGLSMHPLLEAEQSNFLSLGGVFPALHIFFSKAWLPPLHYCDIKTMMASRGLIWEAQSWAVGSRLSVTYVLHPPSVQALMGRGGSVLPFGGCGLTFLLWKLEEILLCLIIIPSGCQVALNALTK